MISKKLLLGFVVSPLATAVILSALAVSIFMITTNVTLRDASDGIDRLLLFSTMLSYVVAIVVGIPLCILSIRRQWCKLWQNSVAGFLAGLGLGVISVLTITFLSSLKWQNSYSPFITIFLFGLAGSGMMTVLWPFIERNKSLQHAL